MVVNDYNNPLYQMLEDIIGEYHRQLHHRLIANVSSRFLTLFYINNSVFLDSVKFIHIAVMSIY